MAAKPAQAFGNSRDAEISPRKLPPLGPREDSNLGQVCRPNFDLKPFRSRRQLSPERKVPNK
jgi:hypothetical protein